MHNGVFRGREDERRCHTNQFWGSGDANGDVNADDSGDSDKEWITSGAASASEHSQTRGDAGTWRCGQRRAHEKFGECGDAQTRR